LFSSYFDKRRPSKNENGRLFIDSFSKIFLVILSQNKKKKAAFCAFGCNNKPVAKLAGLCYKHYQRKKTGRPVGVRFTQFRINALNRKKDFTITLEEFRACAITGYCTVKDRRGKTLN
jgi:hypothetical protein